MYSKKVDQWVKDTENEPMGKGIRVVDSGAHSFFAATGLTFTAKRSEIKQDPEDYILAYVDWIQKQWDNFDIFVELDIQAIVGLEKVKEWRKLYKDAGIDKKMMYCWHVIDGWKEFENIVTNSESRYIGIEGHRSNRECLPYNKFIKYCYDQQCRIHGFAMIKHNDIIKCPFYSVDSSSWSGVYRWGVTFKYHFGKLLNSREKPKWSDKLNVPEFYFENRQDNDVMDKKQSKAIGAYLEYNKFLKSYWKGRGIEWPEFDLLRK